MLVQEAKVDNRAQRVEELVADVAKIAREVGFDPVVHTENVQLYAKSGRHEADVCVWSDGKRVTIESNRHGSRTTHIWVEAAGCGHDGWHSKLRSALRFRAKRAEEEAAAYAAALESDRRRRANEERGLERLGAIPHDAEVVYLRRGAWVVKLDTDDSTIEEAESLIFALRIAAPFRWRRLWKGGVGDQVEALKKSLRFAEVNGLDLDGESPEGKRVLSAVRSQIHGHREVTKDDIDARFRADRAARSRVNLALHGVCASPIVGATVRYCQLEPGHEGEHSIFPPIFDDAEVAQ